MVHLDNRPGFAGVEPAPRRSAQPSALLHVTTREQKPHHPCRVCGGETEVVSNAQHTGALHTILSRCAGRRCASPECVGRDSWVQWR
jgi:hypothetical protein